MADPFSYIRIIAEERILEASRQGQFDNLPGEGKPLELENMGNIPEDLRMAYKILKNAGCLPPEIEDRKEIRSLSDMLDNCREEKAKLAAMKRLRLLLSRVSTRGGLAAFEENEEYYQKALARLERHERACKKMTD